MPAYLGRDVGSKHRDTPSTPSRPAKPTANYTPLGAYPTVRQITRTAQMPTSLHLSPPDPQHPLPPQAPSPTTFPNLHKIQITSRHHTTHKPHALHRLALSPTTSPVSCIQRMTSLPSHQSKPPPLPSPSQAQAQAPPLSTSPYSSPAICPGGKHTAILPESQYIKIPRMACRTGRRAARRTTLKSCCLAFCFSLGPAARPAPQQVPIACLQRLRNEVQARF